MPTYNATVHHFRKPACLNPEEPTTQRALHSLGFTQVHAIRMGGCFILTLTDVPDVATAEGLAKAMCDKLLVNPVTNQYKVESVVEVANSNG